MAKRIYVVLYNSYQRLLERFVLYWKEETFASCKVLKDWRYETWLDYLKKMVEIRGQALMFRRGVGPKNDKGYLRRINMK